VPGIVAPLPEVVDNILRSSDLRAAHAAAIAGAVKQGNYDGILVDYRSTNETLTEQYTQFIDLLAKALHDDGRTLTLMLPMPEADGGEMRTGAFDWEALGALVDSIEVMMEPDQELYFQRTEAALDYIVERVDRGKVLITVTTLSAERGGDGLRLLPFNDAMALASGISAVNEGDIAPNAQAGLVARNLATSEGSSGLFWDDTSRSVTYTYPGLGGKRTVWVANQFSTRFRLELAQRYNLGGVAFNDVSVESGGANVWPAVQEVADSGSVSLSKPNGELFIPQWSANQGTVSPATGDTVTWTAPGQAGPYEITIIVSDGVTRVAQKAMLNVSAPDDAGE
jgi:spore germination protein YaaH